MSSSDPQEEALGSGGRKALTGGRSCAFLLLVSGSRLWEGGGQNPCLHGIGLLLIQFPCLVHLRGRTRSEHPLPRGRALCALNSNVPALRRNAKVFCRVVLLSRVCSVSPRGSCYAVKRTGVEHRAPRSTESLGWAGARRSFPLCPVSAEGYGVPASG